MQKVCALFEITLDLARNADFIPLLPIANTGGIWKTKRKPRLEMTVPDKIDDIDRFCGFYNVESDLFRQCHLQKLTIDVKKCEYTQLMDIMPIIFPQITVDLLTMRLLECEDNWDHFKNFASELEPLNFAFITSLSETPVDVVREMAKSVDKLVLESVDRTQEP
ncbi:hypothetical protein PFISCL1PPCAC_242, partial [Pristionchus fissidentatus]